MMENMKDVRWWRVGFVRIVAIIILAIGVQGLFYNLDHHTLWDFSHFSGPTSISMVLVGIALFVVGFRTEREHAAISKFPHA